MEHNGGVKVEPRGVHKETGTRKRETRAHIHICVYPSELVLALCVPLIYILTRDLFRAYVSSFLKAPYIKNEITTMVRVSNIRRSKRDTPRVNSMSDAH